MDWKRQSSQPPSGGPLPGAGGTVYIQRGTERLQIIREDNLEALKALLPGMREEPSASI